MWLTYAICACSNTVSCRSHLQAFSNILSLFTVKLTQVAFHFPFLKKKKTQMIYFKRSFHCNKEMLYYTEKNLFFFVACIKKYFKFKLTQCLLFEKTMCKHMQWKVQSAVCIYGCECVRLVRARSRSGMAVLVSRCHWGVVMCEGGVRTLWATPGAFSSDHSSSPRVTIETRSSSSEHQATDPPLATVLSFERNRDTLEQKVTHRHLTWCTCVVVNNL